VPQDKKLDLGPSELEHIVYLSGLEARPKSRRTPAPSGIVLCDGKLYKVRAYQSEEDAGRQWEILYKFKHLFARCYGRVGRFLVLEYVDNSMKGDPKKASHQQDFVGLGAFLGELAMMEVDRPRDDRFELWCLKIEAAGIFRPETMDLIRRQYSQYGSMPIRWGIEYYDARFSNFVGTEQGTFLCVDEKHLWVGPRGVSLIKPMLQLRKKDFEKVLKSYCAKVNLMQFHDAHYRRFLLFYYVVFSLAFTGSVKALRKNLGLHAFHWRRQVLLEIIGASRITRLREEAWWRILHRSIRLGRSVKAVWRSARKRLRPAQLRSTICSARARLKARGARLLTKSPKGIDTTFIWSVLLIPGLEFASYFTQLVELC